MRIKASELIGLQLDWAVAKCTDDTPVMDECSDAYWLNEACMPLSKYSPTTDWSQGGPIISGEGIDLHQHRDALTRLYEYNDKRWAELNALGLKVEIVQRALPFGPGRFIQEHKLPGKYHKKWFAAVEFPRWGWKAAEHFPSDEPLIAAMRCYVASKLGDEVEIPKDLP
jgi:Protein of unknown function (DUF2591)